MSANLTLPTSEREDQLYATLFENSLQYAKKIAASLFEEIFAEEEIEFNNNGVIEDYLELINKYPEALMYNAGFVSLTKIICIAELNQTAKRANKAHNSVGEIKQSLDENTDGPKLSDLLADNGQVRSIVWIGIGLATFQQLVGINVVFYYGAVLWQAVGFSESDALLINIISGAVSIGACILTILVIDKIGRKPLLKWGSIGMAITLSLMVISFSNSTTDIDGNLTMGDWGTLALISANTYVFFFNMSWGPVMWVMLGEMFPNQIRGSGLAVSGLFQWSSNFAITMTFPILLTSIGLAGAYGFYAFSAALSAVFVAKFVYETKGVELEDMKGYKRNDQP